MKKLSLVSLSKYQLENDEMVAVKGGGAPTTCDCIGDCECSCTVEPSAEMANNYNTNSTTNSNTERYNNKPPPDPH